jgi:MFS family permease
VADLGDPKLLETPGLPLRIPAGTRALRHRNFRLYWSGQALSLVGTWMQSVAQAWLILTLTNDPFMLGLLSAVQWGPVLLFGLFGGVLADALPKRRVLIVTQSVSMVLAFIVGILALTGAVQEWHVLLLALLLGITNIVDLPTRQSFVYEMVGREDLPNAVALNAASFNGSRIVGPAIAGLAIAAFGIPLAFIINGFSFMGTIGSLLAMRTSELQTPPRTALPRSPSAVLGTLGEGLGYVRRTPHVLLVLVVLGLVSTVGMNFSVVIPPLARDILHAGPEGFGFLMAATGFGALLASVLLVVGRPSVTTVIAGALLLGVISMVLAVSRFMPLSLAAMFLMGLGGITMAMGANTTVQMSVPNELRGRVMSVYTTIFAGTTPIGGLFQGSIASGLGTDVSIFVGGLLSVVVALAAGTAAWRQGLLRRARVPAEARGGPPRP